MSAVKRAPRVPLVCGGRIGLGVGRNAVRVVLVVRERIIWHREVVVEQGAPDPMVELTNAIQAALRAVPLQSRRRVSVMAAIGPSGVQTRLITGLPPVKGRDAVTGMLQEGVRRFFLSNSSPLFIARPLPGEAGLWVSAYDRVVCGAVEDGCRDAGFRLRAVVPTVLALSSVRTRAAVQTPVRWRDGVLETIVTFRPDGCPVSVHIRPAVEPPRGQEPTLIASLTSALARLGDTAWQFADAYAAAIADPSRPTCSRLDGDVSVHRTRLRITVASAMLAFALAAMLAAPGLAAMGESRTATRTMTRVRSGYRNALAVSEMLHATTTELNRVSEFARHRHSATLFLAAISRALPASASISSLRYDQNGGSLVAVAPHATDVLLQISHVTGIVNARIEGSIAPQAPRPPVISEATTPAASRLETVTIRFDWADADPHAADRSVVEEAR